MVEIGVVPEVTEVETAAETSIEEVTVEAIKVETVVVTTNNKSLVVDPWVVMVDLPLPGAIPTLIPALGNKILNVHLCRIKVNGGTCGIKAKTMLEVATPGVANKTNEFPWEVDLVATNLTILVVETKITETMVEAMAAVTIKDTLVAKIGVDSDNMEKSFNKIPIIVFRSTKENIVQ